MRNDNVKEAMWVFWKRRRHVIALLTFFGMIISYTLRVNLSIAIVKMTENRTIINPAGNITYDQEFNWDPKIQGILLGAFFYGYMCTQIFGGWLATRIGGKIVFGFGIGITALLTIFTPPITRINIYLLIAMRIFEGIFEGVTYPASNSLWANWIPPLERSKISTFVASGMTIGTVFALPICGYMSEHLGWPSVFYTFGGLGVIWLIFWICIVKDNPKDDPYISKNELEYITSTLGIFEKEKISHPWKKMLTSPAVWAVFVAHVSETWGYVTMITQLPIFMTDVLDFKLEEAGILSAIPYAAMTIMMWISGNLADYLRSRRILTTTQVRKSFCCGAFLSQAIFMTCTTYVQSSAIAVTCITLAIGLGGFAWSGFNVNYLDIAPKHASILSGIGNTVSCLSGIISPIITGYITKNKTQEEWRIVFFLSSGFYLIGTVIYGIFASGEEQIWSVGYKRKSEMMSMTSDRV